MTLLNQYSNKEFGNFATLPTRLTKMKIEIGPEECLWPSLLLAPSIYDNLRYKDQMTLLGQQGLLLHRNTMWLNLNPILKKYLTKSQHSKKAYLLTEFTSATQKNLSVRL